MDQKRFYVTNFKDARFNPGHLDRRLRHVPGYKAVLGKGGNPPFFNLHLGRVKVLNLQAFLEDDYVEYDDVSPVGEVFEETWLLAFAVELKAGEVCFCLDDDAAEEIHYRIRPGHVELWNPDDPEEVPRPLLEQGRGKPD
jgi:hypothetical protein